MDRVMDRDAEMAPPRVIRTGGLPFVEPGEPVIVDVDQFQYTYSCKLCGHEWSEKKIEKHVEK